MGSSSVIWKHIENFELEKSKTLKEFCRVIFHISDILKEKYGIEYEAKMREYLNKYNIYFDSGIDFKEFVENVCSWMRYDVVGNEYIIYDDLQDKRLYIDTDTMCKPDLFFDIAEEMKGEF